MKRHYKNQGTFLRNQPEPWQQVSFYSSARRLCCRRHHHDRALVQRIGVYPGRTGKEVQRLIIFTLIQKQRINRIDYLSSDHVHDIIAEIYILINQS